MSLMIGFVKLQRHILGALAALVFFLIALAILAISLISENQRSITGINEISGEQVNQLEVSR